jgi:hypothetical protein
LLLGFEELPVGGGLFMCILLFPGMGFNALSQPVP